LNSQQALKRILFQNRFKKTNNMAQLLQRM